MALVGSGSRHPRSTRSLHDEADVLSMGALAPGVAVRLSLVSGVRGSRLKQHDPASVEQGCRKPIVDALGHDLPQVSHLADDRNVDQRAKACAGCLGLGKPEPQEPKEEVRVTLLREDGAELVE